MKSAKKTPKKQAKPNPKQRPKPKQNPENKQLATSLAQKFFQHRENTI